MQVTSTDLFGNKYTVSTKDLIWRPAAYAVVVRHDAILLIKHNQSYSLPGGGVERGELPEKAVLREVAEEAGIKTKNPRLLNGMSTFFTWQDMRTRQFEHYQSILLYYAADYVSGVLSTEDHEPNEKALKFTPTWTPLNELDSIRVGSTVN